MNCLTLIGAASGGRLLHDGGSPEQVLPLRRHIWAARYHTILSACSADTAEGRRR